MIVALLLIILSMAVALLLIIHSMNASLLLIICYSLPVLPGLSAEMPCLQGVADCYEPFHRHTDCQVD